MGLLGERDNLRFRKIQSDVIEVFPFLWKATHSSLYTPAATYHLLFFPIISCPYCSCEIINSV